MSCQSPPEPAILLFRRSIEFLGSSDLLALC
jgi:hypothetical protein